MVLGRLLRVCDRGLVHQADTKHAQLIVAEMGLWSKSNGVSTAVSRRDSCRYEEDDPPLDKDQARCYRALTARANYISADGVDIAFAVNELCREMACPRSSTWHS